MDMFESTKLIELFHMDAEFIAENSELFSLKAKDIEDMWVD